MVAIEADANNEYLEEYPGQEGFNITCTAIGVYPEPELKLYRVRSINETLESFEIESNTTAVLSFQSLTDGFYSITLVSHFQHARENESRGLSPGQERLHWKHRHRHHSTSLADKGAEHYECRLSVPYSDYVEVKRLAIQDGRFPID